MQFRRVVPALVLVLFGVLAAAGLINLAISESDYADLVPAPDAIVFRESDETTFWLSTNRHAVDLRVDSIDIGLGNIQRLGQDSGQVVTLGRSIGCLDSAVSGLTVDSVGDTSVEIDGTIDRGSVTGDVTVHVRRYRTSQEVTSAVPTEKTVSGTSTPFAYDLTGLPSSTEFRVDASLDSAFPLPETRSVTFTTGDEASATSDLTEEAIHLLEDTGIGLIGCHEHDDVVVSLHGDDGEELNRYLVDVGAAGAATPNYTARRVCVDNGGSQAAYLSGGEKVGAVFDNAAFGLSGEIDSVTVGAVEAGSDFRYDFRYDFEAEIDSGEVQLTVSEAGSEAGSDFRYYFEVGVTIGQVQLTVSEAGAAVRLGLDADRIYPVRVTATADGATAFLDVGVWLDTTTLSSGDGLCS